MGIYTHVAHRPAPPASFRWAAASRAGSPSPCGPQTTRLEPLRPVPIPRVPSDGRRVDEYARANLDVVPHHLAVHPTLPRHQRHRRMNVALLHSALAFRHLPRQLFLFIFLIRETKIIHIYYGGSMDWAGKMDIGF